MSQKLKNYTNLNVTNTEMSPTQPSGTSTQTLSDLYNQGPKIGLAQIQFFQTANSHKILKTRFYRPYLPGLS